MKSNVMLVAFGLSLVLPCCVTAQDTQSSMQSPAAPQPATNDSSTASASSLPDSSSSSSYQPPPSDTPPPPPPAPVVQRDRFDQDHGEVGVFADYLRFSPASTVNYVGVGGRVGFNVHPNLALEAEMNYDFARNFTTSTSNGVTTTFLTTSVRPLTGLFGPKLQFGTSSPVRAFLTGKVGFIDFSTSNAGTVSGGDFTGAVSGVGGSGTHLAAYPGGGLEMFAGWFGLRLEAGDEIYLNDGTYNNLRVTAGPVIRF